MGRGAVPTYDIDAQLNAVLLAYQRYYREVFYLRKDRDEAAWALRSRLSGVLGVTDGGTELGDLEQNHLSELFRRYGLHFLGGKSSGFYGPYVWRMTELCPMMWNCPAGFRPAKSGCWTDF